MKAINTIIIIPVLFLMLLQFSSGEILVNTGYATQAMPASSAQSFDTHTFQVDLYYPMQRLPEQGNAAADKGREVSIVIQQEGTEAYINRCEKANFSFLITNPSTSANIYSFSAADFTGIAYITPNVYLSPGESKKIDYVLEPDCSLLGDFNPKIHIETQDGSEEADLPVILHIANGNYVDENSCRFYYDETTCSSDYYIRLNKNSKYKIDLSKWFYDPDGDILSFNLKGSTNLRADIKGAEASITPLKGWYGSETLVFNAEDGKGGEAVSREFYFHVLDYEEKSSFMDFFTNLFS